MYLLPELMLFSVFLVYACIRIRKLIPGPLLKNLFVIFFILLFLGYPVAESLSHRETSGWFRYAMIGGYFCLPFLLYVTLSVLAIDLVTALARVVKLLSRETASGRAFRSLLLAGYLAVPVLVVFAGAWNNNRLLIKQYSIELPQKYSTINHLNIVFASDFHLSQITRDRLLDRFVAKVNALRPDIILIGGDVLEGHGVGSPEKFEKQFRKLKAKYGVYAVPGNHESHGGGARNFFERSGMKLLEDSVEKIDGKFYLAGRKDGRSRKEPVTGLLKAATENLPVILLDHRPTDLENVADSRVDLQLSGHTHDGQLFPVNLLVMPFRYELAWGMKWKRNTCFIVSSGLQAWGPPVKTAGESEILFVRVIFRPSPKDQLPA